MSKKISQLTLKNSLASTDVIPILDSEDSYENKKVLASSISSGCNVHIIENITKTNISGGTIYNGTCADVTSYEEGHIYVYKSPSSYDSQITRYLNINNIGNARLWFNSITEFNDTSFPTRAIYDSMVVVIYRDGDEYTKGFYLLDTTNNSIKDYIWCRYINFGYNSKCSSTQGNGNLATIRQYVVTLSGASISIDYTASSNYDLYRHSCIICSDPLSSLTLTHLSDSSGAEPMWEKEIQFTTDSTFTMTATDLVGKWIGVNTTATFDPNTSYVIKIKNGYGYVYKVGA